MINIEEQIREIPESLVSHFAGLKGVYILNTLKGEEQTQRDNYKGREMLELLQNAVDALDVGDGNNKVFVRLDGNDFEIMNTGTPFEVDGLGSFAYPNNSPKLKKRRKKLIGHKGLGFRSVLNWSEHIEIYSKNGLKVSYSIADTNNYYRERLRGCAEFIADCGAKDIDEVCFPALSFPKILERSAELGEYATSIKLKIFDDQIADVRKQLDGLDEVVLVFLPDVNELVIDCDGERRVYSKRIIQSTPKYEEVELSSTGTSRRLTIFKKSGRMLDSKRPYEIKIAYDEEAVRSKNYIHNYFRTKIRLPIGWRLHATFDLNSERNEINATDYNIELLRMARDFIFEMAEELAKQKMDYSIFSSLMPGKDFDNRLDLEDEEESFGQRYEYRLMRAKLLPTIGGKITSVVENPQRIDDGICEYIDPKENFGWLLKPGLPRDIYDKYSGYWRKPLLAYVFRYFEMTRRREPLKSDLEARARVACLLYKEYRYNYEAENVIPSLFSSESGAAIGADKVYVGEAAEAERVPDFITIKYMCGEQLDYIIHWINHAPSERYVQDAAELAAHDFGKFYHLKTSAIDDILVQANGRLKKDLGSPELLQKHTKSYIDYISCHAGEFGENCKFLLFARDGKLHDASTLYFGKEYGDDLCENLYSGEDELFLASPNFYGENASELKQKLIRCGLNELPRRETRIGGSYYNDVKYYYTYDRLEKILAAGPKYFFRWLFEILPDINKENIKQYTLPNKTCDYEYSWLHREIKSARVFATKKDAYDFDHILEGCPEIGEFVDGVFGMNLADYFSELGVEVSTDAIQKLINLFRIPTSFKMLGAGTFLNIMSKLPEFDYNGKISSKLYNDVTRDDAMPKKMAEHRRQYNVRMDDLLVYTNHGYQPAKKSVYAIYKEPDSLEKIANFIKVQKHTNKGYVKELFGVDTFNRNKIEIANNPIRDAEIGDALEADLADLKAYVLAIRLNISQDKRNQDQDEAHIRRLEIVPTRKVEVRYENNLPIGLEQLDFVRENNTDKFYIVTDGFSDFASIKMHPKYNDSVQSIIAIDMDAERDLDIIWKLSVSPISLREKVYQSGDFSMELLAEARSRLGIKQQDAAKSESNYQIYEDNLQRLKAIHAASLGRYMTAIYDSLELEEQKTLVSRWRSYEDFDAERDLGHEANRKMKTTKMLENDLKEILKEKFPELDFGGSDRRQRLAEHYKKNRTIVLGRFDATQGALVKEYLQIAANNSLLYYDARIEDLCELIRRRLEAEETAKDKMVAKDFEPVNISVVDVKVSEGTSEEKHLRRRSGGGRGTTSGGYIKRGVKNIEKGGKAEYAVRKWLDGEKNVRWHSSYSVDEDYAHDYIETSFDDGIGYDLSYTDGDGNTHYVEVKCVELENRDQVSVSVSGNEFRCAEENEDFYDLYLVEIRDDDNVVIRPIYGFMKKPFSRNAKEYNLTFTLQNA